MSQTRQTRLRQWTAAGIGTATLAAVVPLALAGGGSTASAQQSTPCPSSSPSSSPTSQAPGLPTGSARPTLSGLPSSSGSPAIGLPGPLATLTATGSASPSSTATATATMMTPTACATPSASSTATTGRPSPSTSAGTPASSPLGISVRPTTIVPNQDSVVTLSGTPGAAVELFAYSRPSTEFRRVRAGNLDGGGRISFALRPGTNTRVFGQLTGSSTRSEQVVVNVRTALGLTARRVGVRSYVFEGRLLPRDQATRVSLYRVDASGREVLSGSDVSDPDSAGLHRIERRFTGSGRFTFVARTSQTLINAPGVSNTRVTTIS